MADFGGPNQFGQNNDSGFFAAMNQLVGNIKKNRESDAIQEANEKVKQIKSSLAPGIEQRQAVADTAQDLFLRMSASGADPAAAQMVFNNLTPKTPNTIEQAYFSGDPYMQQAAIELQNDQDRKKAEQQTFIRQENRADRALAREDRQAIFQTNREDKLAVREEKQNEAQLQLAIPGYKLTGEVKPKAEEAMKLRKAKAGADEFKSKLARMKELVKENGPYEYRGDAGREMASIATEMQLLAKSPEMYALGILAGPDMGLLTKVISDPASFDSMFTTTSERNTQIDTLTKSIDNKLSMATKASGYAPDLPMKAAPGTSRVTGRLSPYKGK